MVKIHSPFMLALAMAGAMLAIGGCTGNTVMPTSYDTFNAADGSFQIQYPAGWEVTRGGSRGYLWVKFTSGDAEMLVDTSVAGSLMGDVSKMKIGIVHVEGPEEAPAVEKVHRMEKEGFVEDQGVEEQEPVVMHTGFGDSRRSEFSGTRAFGGTIRGCRVTSLSRDRRIRVVCKCSDSDWQALQPAFDKMINSLAMGSGAY
jgi:hypothetical protein